MEISNRLIIALVLLVVILVGSFASFGWITVQGNEVVVWQKLDGVQEETNRDGTYFYCRITTDPHVYETNSDTFIISDEAVNPKNEFMTRDELELNQPDVPPVEIPVMMERLSEEDMRGGKTTGPTIIKLECVMQYHLDPGSIVKLHRDKTKAFRTAFLKEVVLNTIIENTTILDARTVYQGEGRVRLQQIIEKSLKDNERFQTYGVSVEQFVIRNIAITDDKFLEKMTAEARAEQDRKTAIKQKAAFQAQAEAEEARVKAEQLKRLVEAETKKGEMVANATAEKEKQVLAAQAEAEKVKLAAEAQKERDRLEGEGLKLRKMAEAAGVLELGKAEAEAQKLKLQAYQGEGGQRFAEVEKAKALGQGIQKIYYVPNTMSINAIAKDFNDAVKIGLPQQGGQAEPVVVPAR